MDQKYLIKLLDENKMKNTNIMLSGIREVLIVDSLVQDYEELLLGIDPLIEIRIIAHGEDGISQIIKAIELPSLTKLHVLAHGAPGQINLGGKEITSDDFLSRINFAEKRDLDMVFWSCNVGLGDIGRAFVDSVVEVTGARVLVSQGLIGNAEKGGSWDLDGIVIPPFSKNAQNNYAGVLMPPPYTVTGTAVSLAAGNGWVAGDNLIIRNADSSNSATMVQLNQMRLGTYTTGAPRSIDSATVLDLTIQAADLLALEPLIATEIVVTNANQLVGTAADCEALLENVSIQFGTNLNVLINSGLATVAQVNAIDLDNGTGTITATISDGAATDLATLSGNHAYTVTVTSTRVAATTLTAIDNATSVTVTATAVTTVTGNATQIAALATAAGITMADYSVAPTSSATVVQANQIDLDNGSGQITATISDGAASTLATLSGTHAYTVTVTTASVAATALTAIDNATSVKVSAGAVGTITGSAAQIATAISSTETITLSRTVATTVAAGSAAASDLLTIDVYTDTNVGATAVTTVTGAAVDVVTLARTRTINMATNYNVAPTTDATVIQANQIDVQNGTGTITATISDGAATDLATLSGTHAYTVTVTSTSVAATTLTAIDNATSVTVSAGAVGTITGSAAEIATAISSTETITLSGSVATTVAAGSAAASDLLTIDQYTTTNVGATAVIEIVGTAADIANAVSSSTINTGGSVATIISIGSATATDLNTIDTNTLAIVDATAITGITGNTSSILIALNSSGIDVPNDFNVYVNDLINVGDANFIDNKNGTGVTTATISNGNVSQLLLLTTSGAVNDYTILVTDIEVQATDLISIDTKTTKTLNALAVLTIVGTAFDIAQAISSNSINTSTTVAANIDEGTAAAADIITIDFWTTTPVDATKVTLITGSAVDIISVETSKIGIDQPTNYAIEVDSGLATVIQANFMDVSNGSGTITATISDGVASTLATLTGSHAYTVTVTSATVDALILNDIDSKTTLNLTATAIAILTGNVTDVVTAISAATTGLSGTEQVVLDASTATASQLYTIDSMTSGSVDARLITGISGSASNVAIVLSAPGINNNPSVLVTITDGTATATDLNIIDTKTTGTVDASIVTALSGSATALSTVLTSGITFSGTEIITVSGAASATATELTTIKNATTATVIATAVTDLYGTGSDLNTLFTSTTTVPADITLSGSIRVYVSQGTVNASVLNAIDTYTTTAVNANAVQTIIGSASDIATALNTNTILHDPAVAVIVDGPSAAASNLKTIDSWTTTLVDAASVLTITGAISPVITVVTSNTIYKAPNYAVEVNSGSATVSQANTIAENNGTGTITATISDGAASTLATLSGEHAYTVTVTSTSAAATTLTAIDNATSVTVTARAVRTITGSAAAIASVISWPETLTLSGSVATIVAAGSAAASDLLTIDQYTTTNVNATAVTTVTGNTTDIIALVNESGITLAPDYNIVATSDATVTEANTIDTDNGTGEITATISNQDASTLATLTGTHAYTVTVTSTSAAATTLTAIDNATSVTVTATAVTTVTGPATEIAALATEAGITMLNYSVAPTSSATVTEANTIDTDNGTGTITATISDQDASTLATLTGTHAYTVTVTTASADATALTAIDNATSVTVTATAVTTVNGTAQAVYDFAQEETGGTISAYADYDSVISGVASATQIQYIAGANDNGTINGSTLTAINGAAADIVDSLLYMISAPNNFNSVVSGASNASDINSIEGSNGTGLIDGSSLTAINGTAANILTALTNIDGTDPTTFASTVTGDASLADMNSIDGATSGVINSAGINTLTGLPDGSSITFITATYTNLELSAGDVTQSGDYFFNAGTFTYWDETVASKQDMIFEAAVAIQITGTTTVIVDPVG